VIPWWRRLARYARPYGSSLAVILLLIIAATTFEVLQPWPLQLLIDSALGGAPIPERAAWITELPGAGTRTGLIAWLAAGMVILFLLGQLALLLRSHIQAGLGTKMVYELGGDLFVHLQQLSLRFHGSHAVGDLTRRIITDATCVRGLISGVALPVLASLLRFAVMIAVMWHLDPMLAMLAMVVAPAIVLLIRIFDKPMTERTYQHQRLEGEVMALAEQTLTSLPVVQAYGREGEHDARFRDLSSSAVRASLDATRSQLFFKVGVSSASAIGTALMMVVGGMHVLDGTLSIGELLVFLAYLTALYAPMETLAYAFTTFSTAAASARRVLETLDEPDVVVDMPGAVALEAVRRGGGVSASGGVEFEGVTFGYEPGRAVLSGVSLVVESGSTVALVGTTGAGKSTLVSLVPRFFDPWSGRVLVGGHDVRGVTLESLRSRIALVLQEPFLLPLSIGANIAYGRPGATQGEIESAARSANAHEFISALPEGYGTVLGERGVTLSGGERQRISIARALLKDAPILILDEPTSALDAGTEALLFEALERLVKGRTTLIIAHRLSTVRRADQIIVLGGGNIIERGSHDQLIKMGRHYSRLHELQFGAREGDKLQGALA
jgi:ATP-binding cassette subfamily B protein